MIRKTNIQIKKYLKSLKLSYLKSEFQELSEQASKESLSYEEYLLEILKLEYENRNQKKIEKYLKESKIPLEKTISSFDLKRIPKKALYQFKVLLDRDFLDRKENLLIFGNPGSGKTHLICALSQELISKGKRIYFIKCNFLVQDLLIAKRELKFSKMIKKLSKFDAIIIDDIGYVNQSKREMDVLFSLLSERYEKGSIFITSNLPFSKWGRIFKDHTMATAAIDRLVHHSIIFELNVKSYRMEKATKKIN
jgi:DNA replication protein DnaC